jgi:hypothetical protein
MVQAAEILLYLISSGVDEMKLLYWYNNSAGKRYIFEKISE